jgi:very-short-patch-repair endonuclease
MKQKISTTMKIKAENGEIGCWSNCHFSKRSYAEEWTKKVIENEFEDKKVIEQYHFERYRLDFAWPEKKKCIEIDGKQHETNLIQIESDKRKDERLKRARWQVLRLKWSWIFNNTQEAIIKMKNFINF